MGREARQKVLKAEKGSKPVSVFENSTKNYLDTAFFLSTWEGELRQNVLEAEKAASRESLENCRILGDSLLNAFMQINLHGRQAPTELWRWGSLCAVFLILCIQNNIA